MTKAVESKSHAQKAKMNSRERMLSALRRQPVDYVPCSPFFNSLTEQQRRGHHWQFPWGQSAKMREQVEYCAMELGIDPVVAVSAGGNHPDPSVTSRVWKEDNVIHKLWNTPSGELQASVKYNENWPHGLDIPLYSDFNVGHYVKPWLKSAADLECLRHILLPPSKKEHLEHIKVMYKESKKLADELHLATISSIGSGLTGAQHLFGATELCMMTIDQPELIDGYLELEHQLNIRKMEIAVEMGVDIIRRNGFYETSDFYSPAMLEQFLGKRLRKEIEVVHQAGKLIGYTVHTGIIPMLDYLNNLDFDCIMQIDIAFKDINLLEIQEKLGSKKSFWTGPSNTYHMFSNDQEVVRQAVRDVFSAFGKKGLIITPCPSAHSIMPWKNTLAMIDEWKKLR